MALCVAQPQQNERAGGLGQVAARWRDGQMSCGVGYVCAADRKGNPFPVYNTFFCFFNNLNKEKIRNATKVVRFFIYVCMCVCVCVSVYIRVSSADAEPKQSQAHSYIHVCLPVHTHAHSQSHASRPRPRRCQQSDEWRSHTRICVFLLLLYLLFEQQRWWPTRGDATRRRCR